MAESDRSQELARGTEAGAAEAEGERAPHALGGLHGNPVVAGAMYKRWSARRGGGTGAPLNGDGGGAGAATGGDGGGAREERGDEGVRARYGDRLEGAGPGIGAAGGGGEKRRIGHIVGGDFVPDAAAAPGAGAASTGGAATSASAPAASATPAPKATGHEGERAYVGPRSGGKQDVTQKDGPTTIRIEDGTAAQVPIIVAAVKRARELLIHASSKLNSVKSDPATKTAFQNNFRTTDDKAINKVRMNVAVLLGAFTGTIPIEVESKGDATTRAYVYAIWSDVHLTPVWFADADPEARARTIVHECSHKYCGTDDNAYHWQTGKWHSMSAKDATNNADSYAWFCMDVR